MTTCEVLPATAFRETPCPDVRLDDPYASGDRATLKIKRIRTADCAVGGFRYGTGSKLVGSGQGSDR